MRQDIEGLKERMSRLEGQIALLGSMIAGGRPPEVTPDDGAAEVDGKMRKLLLKLTKKQHAVVQMLRRSASNGEIAQRFHVGENTAKGFVHTIMGHMRQVLGETIYSRVQVAEIGARMIEAVPDEEYERVTLIPKDWDQTWTPDDEQENRHLYVTRTGH